MSEQLNYCKYCGKEIPKTNGNYCDDCIGLFKKNFKQNKKKEQK